MPRKNVPLLLLMLLFMVPAFAAGSVCVNPPEVVVKTDDPAVLAEICGAAGKAIAFLDRYDLRPTKPITVEIVEEKIDNEGYIAYGRYESAVDGIQLMSYQAIFAMAEKPLMYGEPFDRVHYAGVVAHEIAHAVVYPYTIRKKASQVPQEYLAHATQLAVLPEERRNAIIRAMDVGPWEGGDEISQIYMAISPGKFAVKSYLHLTTAADPDVWVQILLNNNWLYVYVPKEKPG